MDSLMNEGSETSIPFDNEREVHYLSAEWINARIMNVRARAQQLLVQRILKDGLLSSGYKPFQFPITDEILLKMSPEQAQRLVDSMPTIEAKQEILGRLKVLKVPPLRGLMVASPAPKIPAQRIFDLAERTGVPLSSSE